MPTRGEVWLVDLGYSAKVRPALVLSVLADNDDDRALIAIVPHTTSVRGSRFEVSTNERFLKAGAFDTQNLLSASKAKFIRRLGTVSTDRLAEVEAAVKRWLGFDKGA